jgi:hypothetical protein
VPIVDRSKADSAIARHSVRRLVTRSIDSIKSSLLIGLLVQRRIAGIGGVAIGAICAGLTYITSVNKSAPWAPIRMVPAMKDWSGSRRAIELGKVTL